MTELKEARRTSVTRHEGFDKQRSWRLLTLFPQERIPKRILEQIMTSTSGRDSQYAANTCAASREHSRGEDAQNPQEDDARREG